MGQSVGRWDGDTLVVEASGFNGQTWFDQMRESLSRTNDNFLLTTNWRLLVSE